MLDGVFKVVHLLFVVGDIFVYLLVYLGVGVGLAVLQPDILHLRFYLVEAQPVRQRDKDVHCLRENLVSLALRHRTYCAQVVQTVCQFYENDSYVVVKGEQDSFEILCLHGFCHSLGGVIVKCLLLCLAMVVIHCGFYLGKAIYKRGYLLSVESAYILYGIFCILYNVVQQRGYNRFVAQSNLLYHYLCNSNRVEYVGLSGASSHPFVRLVCKLKCLYYTLILLLCCASLLRKHPQRFKFFVY